GLARWLDVDPLLVRVAVGVLTVFGGSGVLLYGLAWLLLPGDGQERSEASQALHGRSGAGLVGAIVLVVLGVSVFGVFGIGVNGQPGFAGLLTLVVLAVAVVAAVRSGGRRAVQPPPTSPGWTPADPFGRAAGTAYSAAPPAAPAGSAPGDETVVLPTGPAAATAEGTAMNETVPLSVPPGVPGDLPPYPAVPPTGGYPPYGPYVPFVPPPPARRRERSRLGRATFSLALLAAGVVAAWGAASHDLDAWPLALAAALAVTGLGLVVGAFAGRARGLIALGLVLTLLLSAATVARAAFGGSATIGERTWAPTSATATDPSYDLGIGSGVLDLSQVHPDGELAVSVHVGVGELVVTVPRDVAVDVVARAGAGEVRMPDGGTTSGTDARRSWTSDGVSGNASSAGRLVLDLSVGLGNVEVRRAAS
ncbi:MAG: PspC domain-containing protein, partial [Motilibacteraceae bacterium]